MSQFSLSWNVQKNICAGLSTLQQNGEFVDMTLAADGHLVKVHQIIMALASPYIKELISSTDCRHPVIFLNKVSYTTLCSLLEYVYTGEVLVSVENLKALIEAGKELHIKGIESMTVHHTDSTESKKSKNSQEDFYLHVESVESNADVKNEYLTSSITYSSLKNNVSTEEYLDNNAEHLEDTLMQDDEENITILGPESNTLNDSGNPKTMMQYTVSNQGSLQMILNRFIYYVKHTTRHGMRQWRCVDYVNKGRCPAYVITKNDVVLKRIGVHNHPFHDKRILKKVNANAVFTALNEAEKEGGVKKDKSKNQQLSEKATNIISEDIADQNISEAELEVM